MHPALRFIDDSPEPFRAIMHELYAQVRRIAPEAELREGWGIPCFYLGEQPYCYMNRPPKYAYVDLGFWHSAHMRVHPDHLRHYGRKLVKSLRYRSLEEMDLRVLEDVLREAYSHQGKKMR